VVTSAIAFARGELAVTSGTHLHRTAKQKDARQTTNTCSCKHTSHRQ